MTIEKIAGTDARLYSLVGPLVMRASILRQNNNYPFKTSRQHVWFVALEGSVVVGFLPVEVKDECVSINNYYVSGDNAGFLTAMLREAIRAFRKDYKIMSVAHVRHGPVFQENGFSPVKTWKLYVKMEYKMK